MKLYGKTLFLKRLFHLRRGVSLTMVVTTRCNLHCDYCPMFLENSKYPKYDECSFDEWEKWFKRYPENEAPIFQIEISGGEPTRYKDLSKLINYLIERGKHVVIYTNLENVEILNEIKPSYRFRIKAVYHKSDDSKKFFQSFIQLNPKFDAIINEIGNTELDRKTFPQTKLIHRFTPDEIRGFNAFHVAPDGARTNHIHCGCDSLYNQGKCCT
jgi:uncharacterized radical SAM superfamily Fe-S cluster-containing enzyme